ncbi:MAG: Crp/Fnr family transcriptional regulator [Gammaproteobacteria bacterium]|nr:Crp/Fnr family transcriptional regulator [Gammaproteobacteria bacterium]
MNHSAGTDLPRFRVIDNEMDCDHCEARDRCPGAELDQDQLKKLNSISATRGPFQAGQTIYRMEDKFKALYVIQKGAVKLESVSEDGVNMVDGFFFLGDMFGVDAIGATHYSNDAVALETTWVCELPYEKLEYLCEQIPGLQTRIFKLLAHQIRQINNTIVHNRYLSAEKRVLMFLEALSESNVVKKNNDGQMQLPMSKGDMAHYLGLRPESLSRALGKLANEGVIRNNAKKIELLRHRKSFQLAYNNRL